MEKNTEDIINAMFNKKSIRITFNNGLESSILKVQSINMWGCVECCKEDVDAAFRYTNFNLSEVLSVTVTQ